MFSFQIVALIAVLVLSAASLKKNDVPQALSFENCTSLRGVFALLIMIFHISTKGDPFYPIFAYFSITVVGAFFFLSGYGLMKGFMSRENYRKGYLINRITKLFIPYIIMFLIYWAFNVFIGNRCDAAYVLDCIFGDGNMVMYSWFIKEIIYHYLLFYVLLLIVRDRKEMMYGAAIVMFVIDFFANLFLINNPYLLNGAFCLGIIIAYKEKPVLNYMNRKRKVILPISLFLAFLFRTDLLHYARFFLIEKIIFIIIVLTFSTAYGIQNLFLNLCGKMSLEIYMTHGLAKSIVRRYYGGPLFIQDFFIYPLTFLLSYAFYQLFSLIGNRIRRSLKK